MVQVVLRVFYHIDWLYREISDVVVLEIEMFVDVRRDFS